MNDAGAPVEAAIPESVSSGPSSLRASADALAQRRLLRLGPRRVGDPALAAAKSKGFPCALAWQPAQVFSVTGSRPACARADRSRMMASGMYSLPGPVAGLAPDALREVEGPGTRGGHASAGRVALQAGGGESGGPRSTPICRGDLGRGGRESAA